MTYEWYTIDVRMTYVWYTSDIPVHTNDMRVTYEWHTKQLADGDVYLSSKIILFFLVAPINYRLEKKSLINLRDFITQRLMKNVEEMLKYRVKGH